MRITRERKTGTVPVGGTPQKKKGRNSMNLTNGITIAALLVLIVAVCLLSRRKEEEQFDERQLRVRADAFRIGFFSMLGSVFAMMILFSWKFWVNNVETMFTLIAAVMIAFLIFAVYCITHDAFFRRKENPKSYLGICLAVVFCNVAAVLRYIGKGSLLVDGKVTLTPCGNILFACTFAIVAVVLLVKILTSRSEEEED